MQDGNTAGGGESFRPQLFTPTLAMKGRTKSKRTKGAKRYSKLLLKLSSWGNYIDEAYQLESMLAKKPARLQIEFVGSGEIPPDSALLMRSMLLKRSPQTRIVTNARSSLQGATLLIWLLGDTRLLREDARCHFRPAGPFVADDASTGWKDRSCFDADDMEEEDYVRVLQAINEFLPVKELAGRPVEASVLKEFGLIDNVEVDGLLASAFGRAKERRENSRTSPKTSELGIVMGGMHFAGGIPARNLRIRLQDGFHDAPLGRRPALAHRGRVFEQIGRAHV